MNREIHSPNIEDGTMMTIALLKPPVMFLADKGEMNSSEKMLFERIATPEQIEALVNQLKGLQGPNFNALQYVDLLASTSQPSPQQVLDLINQIEALQEQDAKAA